MVSGACQSTQISPVLRTQQPRILFSKDQPLPLSAFCCQNEQCEDYEKKGLKNIYRHCWQNWEKTIRKLRCRTCQTSFSDAWATAGAA